MSNTTTKDSSYSRPTISRNFERDRGSTGGGSSSGWGRQGQVEGADSRPCHAFQRGQCRDGDACRYLHQQQQQKQKQPISGSRADSTGSSTETAVSLQASSHSGHPSSTASSFENTTEKEAPPQSQTSTNPTKPMKCPARLFRSRDSLFKGIHLAQRKNIVMDTVASFSVTESQMADRMTDKILEFAEKVKPHDNVIFDGMACVGE